MERSLTVNKHIVDEFHKYDDEVDRTSNEIYSPP